MIFSFNSLPLQALPLLPLGQPGAFAHVQELKC